ncbi:MAG: acetate--CoA ligase family protein [Planctomycetota bacterium]
MLDALFAPKSVAVIGASNKELTIGYRIIQNLVDFGYRGHIYPVNPKNPFIKDFKAYKSVLEIPDPVDLAHIVIPNKFVPQAVEECGKKGVKFIIINSAGFKEIGEDGIKLEKQCVEIAHKYGVRLFGPNCQGVINTDSKARAYCNFTFTRPEAGYISIIAQSGGVGEVINQRFSELGVGVRMYASNGNACDVSIPEIIKYWGDDPKTRVILVHIESISNPKEFLKVASEVAAKKPVLGMKTGRTQEGAKAVASHTGGLMREDITTEIIFEKAGIVMFRDQENMCQAAIAFASQPAPKGSKVGMITNTGGPAIIATDILVEHGASIPTLSENSVNTLKSKLYEAASVNNPVDVLATATPEHFRAAADTLLSDSNIDSILINFVTPFFADTNGIASQLSEAAKAGTKPIVCNLMTDKSQWTETIRIMKDSGIPFYSFAETAAKALSSMIEYNRLKSRTAEEPKSFEDVDKEKVLSFVAAAREEKRRYFTQLEAYETMEAYKISVAKGFLGETAKDVEVASKYLKYPYVLKVEAADIVHKTDAGGVVLNIQNAEELNAEVSKMADNFKTHNPRFYVQEQLPHGKEVIIGASAVQGLGHLIMFGLGGIYVEVLKDVKFRIAPVSCKEALQMIESVKGYPILRGMRGKQGVDIDALVETIQRVSQLLSDVPEIAELDLNPVFAYSDGAKVVDVRIAVQQ